MKKIKLDNSKNYKVNVIYTFDKKEQLFCDVICNEKHFLNKELFLEKLTTGVLTKSEVLQLTKISTCVYQIEQMKSKTLFNLVFDDDKGWYMKYGGKFYVQSGDFFSVYPHFKISPSMGGGKFKEPKKGCMEYYPSPLVLNY